MKKRVVITGMGVLSPLGLDTESTWKAILAGKSGVASITRFDTTDFPVTIAAEVKNFDPSLSLDKKESRKHADFVQFCVEASRQAVLQADINLTEDAAYRAGVSIGSGIGGFKEIVATHEVLRKGGPRKVSPFFIPCAIINMAPGLVSMKHGLKGPNFSAVTACATGAHNIGLAMRAIQAGDADLMVAGGTEMCTTPLAVAGFASARAMSRNDRPPEEVSRPWDVDRDGFVLGEGAGIMVLESLEHAQARGATILAEIAGFGMSGDAYHMTAPDPDGVGFVRCMEAAIKDSGLSPAEIQYVNAHGTSTMADYPEANSVAKVFGGYASSLAMSSTKSMTGHMLGATGAIEAIFCALAIRDKIAPPTINLDKQEFDCDIDLLAHEAKEMPITACLTNSFGFGGTNTSLVLKAFVE